MHIFPNFRIQCIGWSCSFLEWWSLLCAMRQRFRYKKSPFFDVSILPRLIDHHIHKYVVEVDRVHCSARVWLETRPGSSKVDSARFLILWLEDSTSQSKPKELYNNAKNFQKITERIFKNGQNFCNANVINWSLLWKRQDVSKKDTFKTKIQFKIDLRLSLSS